MLKGRNPAEKIWIGTLHPTEESPVYTVKIAYRERGVPTVWVVSPPLKPDAPHTYGAEGGLCLYTPSEWNWQGDRVIAETIIPWTVSWLRFYELWLDTGKWLGPETPHSSSKTPGHST
jgi:hypothetical protein